MVFTPGSFLLVPDLALQMYRKTEKGWCLLASEVSAHSSYAQECWGFWPPRCLKRRYPLLVSSSGLVHYWGRQKKRERGEKKRGDRKRTEEKRRESWKKGERKGTVNTLKETLGVGTF